MTLDEAIQHAEEVVEDKETRAKECIVKANSNNEWLFDYEVRKLNEESVSCAECAAEHRQLAEWLKDYKRLLEQEPCEDCIRREDALMALTGQYADSPIELLPKAIKQINALLPVTPAEKVGRWEWVQYDANPNIGNWHCSECDRIVSGAIAYSNPSNSYKYCPNCGAKMERAE